MVISELFSLKAGNFGTFFFHKNPLNKMRQIFLLVTRWQKYATEQKKTIGPTLYTDKGYRISVKTIYKIYEVYGISFCLRFKKSLCAQSKC
jgi:hypothetical protein